MKNLTLAFIFFLNLFLNSFAFASPGTCPSSSTTYIPFGFYPPGCTVTNSSTLQIGQAASLPSFIGTSPQITVEQYSVLKYAKLNASQSIKILSPLNILNNATLTTGDLCIAGSGQAIELANATITCNRTNKPKHYFLLNGVSNKNLNCTHFSSTAIPNCR